jgi:hypothetical protein
MTEWDLTKVQAATRLLELISMRLISASIHVAAALGVADLLADAPQNAEQLAAATGVSASSLQRVLRGLVTFNVFSQDSSGRFALAPMGAHRCSSRRPVPAALAGSSPDDGYQNLLLAAAMLTFSIG